MLQPQENMQERQQTVLCALAFPRKEAYDIYMNTFI